MNECYSGPTKGSAVQTREKPPASPGQPSSSGLPHQNTGPMYIPFRVHLATQVQCVRRHWLPIARPRVRLAVIVCIGILFTPFLHRGASRGRGPWGRIHCSRVSLSFLPCSAVAALTGACPRQTGRSSSDQVAVRAISHNNSAGAVAKAKHTTNSSRTLLAAGRLVFITPPRSSRVHVLP
jgi:hypothetical protein